ncbi:MAG: hypothetical protein NTV93_20550 [Verrucomicrobia bacterium]|nr:hypothetical protein [Verrucomicrobiota bacterium]
MMKLDDLRRIYTEDDLSYYPGDRELRYRLFSPFLANLAGKKVVYHERFVAIVELSAVEVTTERFSAVATILLHVEQRGRPLILPRRPWRFGGHWEHMMLGGHHFHVPYAAWSIWPEPEIVSAVEEHARNGRFTEALKLSVFDDF